MKIKILSCLLIFLGLIWLKTISGQTVYFNKTIDLASEWGSGMSVLAADSAFHIAAITDLPKKITIVELTQSGEVNWIKKYGNSLENWYPGNPGSLCTFPSGGNTLAGSIESSDTNYGLLLKFDHQFDTLFSKRYVSFNNYSLILTCSKPTYDGGLIFTGSDYISGSNTNFILLKTDSLGNEVWRAIKSLGMADRGWSIIQTPDSGYVIGGYHYNPGVYHSGDPLILKFDKNGTFLWSRNPGGPFWDGKAMVCRNADSTFTALTAIADSIYVFDFDYARICVIKYSQNGMELWKKKYVESIGGNFVLNIKSLPDWGYICCGEQNIPGNYDIYRSGWLLRLNADGDSLWFRRFTYFEDIPFYSNGLRDVSLCQEGGFIATGEVWDHDHSNGLQKIWVLKVDSLGCEFAGCDTTVGVEEQGGGEAGKQGGMVIWPNPASSAGVLSVKGLGLSAGISYSISIYDLFGREIRRIAVPETEHEIQFSVENLAPGLYLVVLKDESQIIGSAKMVVSR